MQAFLAPRFALSCILCLSFTPSALAQRSAETSPAESIPDAPIPVFDATPPTPSDAGAPQQQTIVPAATQPNAPMTLGQRFRFEARRTFGPSAFIVPAGEAGIVMADPPHGYPRDWSDGGGAFGRNYGAELGRHATGGMAHFTIAAIDREDPRYYTTPSNNFAIRFAHALFFTLIDRNDSGHPTLALSNLSGSAAAGFVGMTWEPSGFDDTTHAYQRAALEMTTFAGHNVIAEFSPELSRLTHKLHIPDRWINSLLPQDRNQP